MVSVVETHIYIYTHILNTWWFILLTNWLFSVCGCISITQVKKAHTNWGTLARVPNQFLSGMILQVVSIQHIPYVYIYIYIYKNHIMYIYIYVYIVYIYINMDMGYISLDIWMCVSMFACMNLVWLYIYYELWHNIWLCIVPHHSR